MIIIGGASLGLTVFLLLVFAAWDEWISGYETKAQKAERIKAREDAFKAEADYQARRRAQDNKRKRT